MRPIYLTFRRMEHWMIYDMRNRNGAQNSYILGFAWQSRVVEDKGYAIHERLPCVPYGVKITQTCTSTISVNWLV